MGPLEVKAGNDRELLHGELLGGLLMRVAAGTPDFGSRAQVLRLREPLQTVLHKGCPINIHLDIPA